MFARTIARHSAVATARKYVSPSHHMWVTLAPDQMTPPTPGGRHRPPSTYRIEMGLTSYGLRNIGDVQAVRIIQEQPSSSVSSSLPPDDDGMKSKNVMKDESFLLIDWEGYAINSADELYHTVWENTEGTYEVKSPVTGILHHVRKIDSTCQEDDLDETDVLAVVTSTRSDLEDVVKDWMDEKEYYRMMTEKDDGGVEVAGQEGSKSDVRFMGSEAGWSG